MQNIRVANVKQKFQSELLGLGLSHCLLTSPPGDSDVHLSLRTGAQTIPSPEEYVQLLKVTQLLLMEPVQEPESTRLDPISTAGVRPCAVHHC